MNCYRALSPLRRCRRLPEEGGATNNPASAPPVNVAIATAASTAIVMIEARRGTRLQFHQIFFYVLLIHSFISLFSLHDGIARDFKYYEVDCQFKFAKRPFEQLYS
jgi:hypothetical protein